MKKLLLLYLAVVGTCGTGLFAQSTAGSPIYDVVFYTDDPDVVGSEIRIGGAIKGYIGPNFESRPIQVYANSRVVIRVNYPNGTTRELNFWHSQFNRTTLKARLYAGKQRPREDALVARDSRGDSSYSSGDPNDDEGEENEGSSSSTSGGSSRTSYIKGRDAAAKLGLIVVAAAATAAVGYGVAYASTDFYFRALASYEYAGMSLGFRNSMDPHIDVELGTSFYLPTNNTHLMPKFMKTGADFNRSDGNWEGKKDGAWTLDANVLYNIRKRGVMEKAYYVKPTKHAPTATYYNEYTPKWNAVVGIGTSTIVSRRPSRGLQDGFAIGPVVGVSMGMGGIGKLELRYKLLVSPGREREMFNQLELGIAIRYKKGFRFKEKNNE